MHDVWLLTRSYLKQHPARFALTALAMVASACMVVWVVSGYDALLSQFHSFSEQSFGKYNLNVIAVSPPGQQGPPGIGNQRTVPDAVVEQLRADPGVLRADPMWMQRAMVGPFNPGTFGKTRLNATTRRVGQRSSSGPAWAAGGPGGPAGARGGPPRGGVGMIGTNANEPPYPMVRGRWIDLAHPEHDECCLSADVAARVEVDVGGYMQAGIGDHQHKLLVVGVVGVPTQPGAGDRGAVQVRAASGGGMYVPMPLAAAIQGHPAATSFVSLVLKANVDANKLRFAWQPKLDRVDPPLQFQNHTDLEEELDSSATAKNLLMQAYSATGISMLAGLFIIFTTLSMGVSERARQFAVLRAVALTRSQIALLIGIESLLLGILGWLGGVAAGYGMLVLLRHLHPDGTGTGPLLGVWSVALSGTCAFGGALAAAAVPTVRAVRMRPLDALAPAPRARSIRGPVVAGLIGFLLVLVNPLLTFVIPQADESRQALFMGVGCTTMTAGFILLTPALVLLADKLIGPVLARLLALNPKLLAGQLSSNLWRTVGTSAALSIGLGLYIAIQVWGYTMLKPFVPGTWAPDAMLAFLPDGLPRDSTPFVAKLPGIKGDTLMPLAVEQAKLTDDVTHSASRATVTRQDNVILIGLNPDRAFGGGDQALLKPQWVQGDPATVIPLLKKGRYVVVPQHFCRESGLKVGDTFRMNPADETLMAVTYTIAGTVDLPGWHWISKFSGVRMTSARSSAMVFADYMQVSKDFELDNNKFFWVNGAEGPKVDAQALATAAVTMAENEVDQPFQVGGMGFPSDDRGSRVRVTTVADIQGRITARADGWIWAMSRLPLVTLIVSSIGVLNAILASVRARTWDMGVLRALGFTRWTLVRLVVAEALLVGLVACGLSLAIGIMAGWTSADLSQYVSFFGGLHPSLTIPIGKLWLGLTLALSLCFAAALWPAIHIGRADVLRLLQAGRTAL